MSAGINCLNESVLEQFLGVNGVEELRSKVIDMIVEVIREQLAESYNYIISPDDITSELFDRITNDIYKEIIDEYKEKVSEAVKKKLGALGI